MSAPEQKIQMVTKPEAKKSLSDLSIGATDEDQRTYQIGSAKRVCWDAARNLQQRTGMPREEIVELLRQHLEEEFKADSGPPRSPLARMKVNNAIGHINLIA
jgi:hypothetical protein